MTPLPKHLEEIRDKQAEIADTKDYSGCSDSGIIIGYRKGFNQAASILLKDMESMAKALEFYTLKSNYSIVDEGRNYNVEYKCYELNEETYADEELGTKASEVLKIWREKYSTGKVEGSGG